ncbi:uncharacterized protein [Oscarella lobularis]|uniref:uncharacterized protein n=1 Tax=Oscarella lobularis TaxID=121494 RepID=UPI003313929B
MGVAVSRRRGSEANPPRIIHVKPPDLNDASAPPALPQQKRQARFLTSNRLSQYRNSEPHAAEVSQVAQLLPRQEFEVLFSPLYAEEATEDKCLLVNHKIKRPTLMKWIFVPVKDSESALEYTVTRQIAIGRAFHRVVNEKTARRADVTIDSRGGTRRVKVNALFPNDNFRETSCRLTLQPSAPSTDDAEQGWILVGKMYEDDGGERLESFVAKARYRHENRRQMSAKTLIESLKRKTSGVMHRVSGSGGFNP